VFDRPTPGAWPLAARLTLGGLCALALATGPIASATAKPDPVFPSQKQVDTAKAKVVTTQDQVAALTAQYQAASAQLDSVQEAASAAGEAYNGAKLLLDQRTAAAARAAEAAAQARSASDDAEKAIRQFAALAYQQDGSLGNVSAFMSASGPQDMVDRATALDTMGELRTAAYAKADAASQNAAAAQRNATLAAGQQQQASDQAAKALADAQAQATQAAAAATQIQGQQTQMASELASLQKTSVEVEQARQAGLRAEAIARAAAEEAARQARIAAEKAQRERTRKAAEEAARAKAAAELAAKQAAQAKRVADAATAAARKKRSQGHSGGSSTSRPPSKPSQPAPSPRGGVSAVLAYARAQVGKWYVWGAAGPNTFDCSGLTMMAWRQAGVYIDHYTGSQYNETRRVAISDLQPGDLVFYGDSGPTSHHVGLYIGGGQMIEAPHTGAQVRYASIYRSDLLPYGGRP